MEENPNSFPGVLGLILFWSLVIYGWRSRAGGTNMRHVTWGVREGLSNRAAVAFRFLGKPVRGVEGDSRSLIKARRFREASRLIGVDDIKGRTRLALARWAPLSELLRIESTGSWLDRRRANGFLVPNAPWLGVSKRILIPWRGDPMAEYDHRVSQKVAAHHFDAAAKLYERLIAKFPGADALPRWQINAAVVHACAGRAARARDLAVEAANQSENLVVAEAASRYLRRLEQVPDGSRPVSLSKPGERHQAFLRRLGSNGKGVAPTWPVLFTGLYTPDIKTVATVEMRPDTLEAVLERQCLPFVCLVSGVNMVTLLVTGFEPASQSVVLSDGDVLTWDTLRQRSLWSDLMVVVETTGRDYPWESVPISESPMAVMLDDDGGLRYEGDTLATIARLAEDRPDDPLIQAAHLYSLVVTPAPPWQKQERVKQTRLRATLCRLRYPGLLWPRVLGAAGASDLDPTEASHSIAHLDLLDIDRSFGSTQLARGILDLDNRDFHWREAECIQANEMSVLRGVIDSAQARGDLPTAAAAIHVMDVYDPGQSVVEHNARLLSVMRHGPRGALAKLPTTVNTRAVLYAKAGLASAACDASLLTQVAEQADEHVAYDALGPVAAMRAALHMADADRALRAFRDGVERHGPGRHLASCVSTVALGLLSLEEIAPLATELQALVPVEPAFVAYVAGELRGTHLWRTGLDLERAVLASGMNPIDAQVEFVRSVLAVAAGLPAPEREKLVAEAIAGMDANPAVESLTVGRHMKAALERWVDAEQAWQTLQKADHSSFPLLSFALGDAICSARGETALAMEFSRRAANPDVLAHGMAFATSFALAVQLDEAVHVLDPVQNAPTVWGHYGAGGRPASLAPLSYLRWRSPLTCGTDAVITRLALESRWELLAGACASRLAPLDMLESDDHALPTAFAALAKAGVSGRPGALEELRSRSSHPAVQTAAVLAERAGLGCRGAESGASAGVRAATAQVPRAAGVAA